ncbi:hypothetical protein GCM10010199_53150 [Dactylosporangium roseum]
MSTSGPESDVSLLSKLTGKGRIVLTASTADQRAWESRWLGHGLLTHSLLKALLNSAQIATDGRFDLHDLLRDVTGRVKASASGSAGAFQDPTVRLVTEGNVFWPVFSRGQRYNALFPPLSPVPVTSDVRSLSDHGIPDAILTAWPDDLVLNQLQQDAPFTRHEISRYERGLRIPTAPLLTAMADSLDLPMAVLRRTAAADRKRRHAGSRR